MVKVFGFVAIMLHPPSPVRLETDDELESGFQK
jgi:hypothetical protein